MTWVLAVGRRAAARRPVGRRLVGMGSVVGVFGLALVQALPADARSGRANACKSPTAPSSARCAYELAHRQVRAIRAARRDRITSLGNRFARTLIFGAGDYGSTEPITDLQQLLQAAGYSVNVSTTLPLRLAQYKAIWYVDAQNALSAADQTRLGNFVRAGKGLFLTGERPCCESLNQSDQALVNSLVAGGGVQVGGLGDQDFSQAGELINPTAIDGLARYPNFVSDWTPSAPGGLAGVSGANVTTTAPSGVPTGAAWDQSEMAGGRGRLVIQMDVNWLEWSIASQQSDTAFAQNIQSFLFGRQAPAPSGSQYVALGDSYASGEGSFSYLPSSNTVLDRCHRATNGYAEQLSAQFSLSLGFAACSGAIVSDLYMSNAAAARLKSPPERGNLGEAPQFSSLGPNTRLVTLSIGGNDAGFFSVLKDCVSGRLFATGSYGCQGRDQSSVEQNISGLMYGRPAGCRAYVPYANPGNNTDGFCGAEPSLQTVYDDIAALAPNAAIYVIGYPHLFGSTFNNNGACDIGGLGRLRYTVAGSDVAWMNSEADLLDQDIQSSVTAAASATGHSIAFVDPRSTFAGHGVCDSGAPWINALVLPEKPESFHPNTTGQQMLDNLIPQTILGVAQF